MKKVKENVEKEDATNRDLEIYVMKTIAKKVKGIQLGSLLFLTGINTELTPPERSLEGKNN